MDHRRFRTRAGRSRRRSGRYSEDQRLCGTRSAAARDFEANFGRIGIAAIRIVHRQDGGLLFTELRCDGRPKIFRECRYAALARNIATEDGNGFHSRLERVNCVQRSAPSSPGSAAELSRRVSIIQKRPSDKCPGPRRLFNESAIRELELDPGREKRTLSPGDASSPWADRRRRDPSTYIEDRRAETRERPRPGVRVTGP